MVGSGYFPLKAGERRSLVLVGPCELLVRLVVPGGGSHGRGKWSVVEERGGGAAGWGAAAGVRGDPPPVHARNPTSAADLCFSDQHTEAQGEARIPLAKIPLRSCGPVGTGDIPPGEVAPRAGRGLLEPLGRKGGETGSRGRLHPARVRGRVVGRKVRARGDPARQLGTQSPSGWEGGAGEERRRL